MKGACFNKRRRTFKEGSNLHPFSPLTKTLGCVGCGLRKHSALSEVLFYWESYAAIVHCQEFGGFLLLGSSKCIVSTRIVPGIIYISTVVHYMEDVCC